MAAHNNASAKAIEIARKMKVEVEAGDNVELKSLMGDLILQLVEVQIETAGRIEELGELKQRTALSESMKQEGDVFYHYPVDGSEKDGPFCFTCFVEHERKIQLVNGHEYYAEYWCPSCKNTAGKSKPIPPPVMVV